MTPAQHKTEAENRTSTLEAGATGHPHTLGIGSPADLVALEAHAHLAQTLGTGTHYTQADSLLAQYDQLRGDTGSRGTGLTGARLAHAARAHALLADR